MILTSTSNINTPAIGTAATALAENTARIAWGIQNVGQNPLFVRMGSGASASLYHRVLKGGTADSDGLGGSLDYFGDVYTGIISVDGTSPKYVSYELAP